MQIQQTYTWNSVNWPTATGAATEYAIFQLYPTGMSTTPLQTVGLTQVTLTYDDTQNYLYQVRPTDGTNYGAEVTCISINFVPCRAYIRQRVRYAIADQAVVSGVPQNWTDDEVNGYINEAVAEVSVLFPGESDTTITLLPAQVNSDGFSVGTRSYPLPSNMLTVKKVLYNSANGNLKLYLKEKPFRGGESTAMSYVGYPKLGILISPTQGRYYPGHYEVYEGNLVLDWDPNGDGDYLTVWYANRYSIPVDDGTLLTIPQEDLELISLRTQMKCWLRVEGQDTRLSRFRDPGKRDDLPTEKMSDRVKKLYNEVVNDRREKRVRTFRMVRR